MSLACHLHDAKRGNGKDVVLCFISGHFTLHTCKHGVSILLRLHIYEVEDNETTDVTQAYLAANLCSRFKVHLEDEVLAVLVFILVRASININRDKGFRLFNYNLAATR